MCDDVHIGQLLVVTATLRQFPFIWDEPSMQHTIGCVGTVQAIRLDKDLVLLQLFFEDQSILQSFWLPVGALREPDPLNSPCR